MGLGEAVAGLFGGGAQIASAKMAADASKYGVDQAVQSTRETNLWNKAESKRDRAWKKDMSDTSYQRSVVDMKAAGLNPAIMLQGGGSGASTPGGTVIPAKSSAAAHSAGGAQKAQAMLSMGQGTAQIASAMAHIKLMKKQGQHIDAETASEKAHESLIKENKKRVEYQNVPLGLKANIEAQWPRLTGYSDYVIDRMGGALKGAATAFGISRGMKLMNKGGTIIRDPRYGMDGKLLRPRRYR